MKFSIKKKNNTKKIVLSAIGGVTAAVLIPLATIFFMSLLDKVTNDHDTDRLGV